MDTIIFASLYTILLMVVSAVHYFWGHREGIKDTLEVISSVDPTILPRIKPKLKDIANAETDA
jgi:hypothetical protein